MTTPHERVRKTTRVGGRRIKIEEATKRDQDVLRVLKEVEFQYQGFNGEIHDGAEWSTSVNIPENVAYEVMHALAEFYNCEVVPE